MSRTRKNEHKTDGLHIGHQIERQARPAGQAVLAFAADLDLDAEES
jgi:hypothetical protein